MRRKLIYISLFSFVGVALMLATKHAGRAIQITNYLYFLLIGISFLKIKEEKHKLSKPTRTSFLIGILLILVPVIIVFRPLLSTGTIAWGDAPHFNKTEMNELISEPYAWSTKGENLGGVDPRLYITPILILWGLLGKLGLTSELIVRIIFYLPSIILSLVGPYLLAKHLRQSTIVQFTSTLLYVLNTYFILIVDGGQVGVLLAYGLFPLTIYFIFRLLEKPNKKNFFIALIALVVNTIADPRIAIIALLVVLLWLLLGKVFSIKNNFENSKYLILLIAAWILTNLYWLYPAITISSTSISAQSIDFRFTSLLNGLTLFAPHWPNNIFGKVVQPTWIFIFYPLLILAGFIYAKKRESKIFFILFLIFVFLVKGDNFPFGFLYSLILNKVPFGTAFRDPTKFFIPVTLFAGLLAGNAIESIGNKVAHLNTKFIVLVFYAVVVLSTLPAISGRLNFVLSGKSPELIGESLTSGSFSRTIWLPETAPISLETNENQALDADSFDVIPLEELTAGSSDKFNYVYQSEDFLTWYKIFGIEKIVLSTDTRNPFLDDEEQKSQSKLVERFSELNGLNKVNIKSDYEIYQLVDGYGEVYSLNKIAIVIGSSLDRENQFVPAVYLEDGKADPLNLEGIDNSVATLVFNHTDEDDLTMSFLQNTFQNEASSSDWKKYRNSDYLLWKYQLLIRGMVANSFTYNDNVLLSDQSGETIKYKFQVKDDSSYVLAVRSLGNGNMHYSIGDESGDIGNKCEKVSDEADNCRTYFGWYTLGINLAKGSHNLFITNSEGTNVVNEVALIPVSEWNKAKQKTEVFVKHFGVTNLQDLNSQFTENYSVLDYTKNNPVWFDFKANDNPGWIVLNNSFHSDWKLKKGINYTNSLPLYSTVNVFYVGPNWKDTSIRFIGQEKVRWGLYYSAIVILSIIIVGVLLDK